MMGERVYLDWNATAPLRPEARDAMVSALDITGNPSSVHGEGRAAKAVVERARAKVASLCGCKPGEVVFTSGATEAATVLAAFARSGSVYVEPTAHDAVWAHHAPHKAASGTEVLALGLANSETGAILTPPSRDADGKYVFGDILADLLFLDVTQAVGRIPWSFHWSGAVLACLSAHKLGGPKGVGALLVRDGLDIPPLLFGGGQELGRRSGTENVAAIAGFGAAAEAAERDLSDAVWSRVEKLRNILESTLASSANETIFIAGEGNRLPNTSCFVTPGWKGETQVMQMDLAGFAVSSGSACSSGKVKVPRVLRAMGLDDRSAEGALRVSIGPTTTEEEVLRFAEAWLKQESKFRRKAA